MKLKRLLSVLDVCECTADPELDIRDISFDSRTTQPGDLFAVDELEQQLGGTMARTDDIAAHNGQVLSLIHI